MTTYRKYFSALVNAIFSVLLVFSLVFLPTSNAHAMSDGSNLSQNSDSSAMSAGHHGSGGGQELQSTDTCEREISKDHSGSSGACCSAFCANFTFESGTATDGSPNSSAYAILLNRVVLTNNPFSPHRPPNS